MRCMSCSLNPVGHFPWILLAAMLVVPQGVLRELDAGASLSRPIHAASVAAPHGFSLSASPAIASLPRDPQLPVSRIADPIPSSSRPVAAAVHRAASACLPVDRTDASLDSVRFAMESHRQIPLETGLPGHSRPSQRRALRHLPLRRVIRSGVFSYPLALGLTSALPFALARTMSRDPHPGSCIRNPTSRSTFNVQC